MSISPLRKRTPRTLGRGNTRLIIALVIGLISVVSYLNTAQQNPITGESQRVAMSAEQEIAVGLQAAQQMAQQHGGLDRDRDAQAYVDRIGRDLVNAGPARQGPYPFEFHLLADAQTVNAFALPGGQVFVTRALFDQLRTPGELAGVIGHEIGHVIERHGAQRMAKQKLTSGLTGAAVIATYDPQSSASRGSAAVAAMVGGLINMKYGRTDELESDEWGVALLANAGYDPRAMIGVMEVLAAASKGSRKPEFMSTHPSSATRIQELEETIARVFPDGVPAGLIE